MEGIRVGRLLLEVCIAWCTSSMLAFVSRIQMNNCLCKIYLPFQCCAVISGSIIVAVHLVSTRTCVSCDIASIQRSALKMRKVARQSSIFINLQPPRCTVEHAGIFAQPDTSGLITRIRQTTSTFAKRSQLVRYSRSPAISVSSTTESGANRYLPKTMRR